MRRARMRSEGRTADGTARWIVALSAGAFLIRLAVRWWLGVGNPQTSGYSLFLDLATSFLNGSGLCLGPSEGCAIRPPVYSLFLAGLMGLHLGEAGRVVAQALAGAALVAVTFQIGCELMGRAPGLLAAGAAALNPYLVVHDTALQDTVLANLFVAAAIWLLLRLRRVMSSATAAGAGILIALAVLTNARFALLLPIAVAWALYWAGPTWSIRTRTVAALAVPLCLLIGLWLIRNERMVGGAVLTTVDGQSLWVANNPWSMNRIPRESIDRSTQDSFAALTRPERAALEAQAGHEVARDRILAGWGRHFMWAHPALSFERAVRKIAVPLGAYLSPARSPRVQLAFALVYLPIHVLACVGAWRRHLIWREDTLTYAVFVAFMLTSGVYWAHTSHASYLDPLWFVYAASAIVGASKGLDRRATIFT